MLVSLIAMHISPKAYDPAPPYVVAPRSIAASDIAAESAAVIAVGVSAKGALCAYGQAIDSAWNGMISRAVNGLSKSSGAMTKVHAPTDKGIQIAVVYRLPEASLHAAVDVVSALSKAAKGAIGLTNDKVLVVPPSADVCDLPGGWTHADMLERTAQAVTEVAYHPPEDLKKRPEGTKQATQVTVVIAGDIDPDSNRAVQTGQARGIGVNTAKYVADMPSNIAHPPWIADYCAHIASMTPGLSVKSLGQKELEAEKMGCFLSVSQGSAQEPRLVVCEYNGTGKKDSAPVVLVGKGVTFDTGGISLKPAGKMWEMRWDMCGAATVFGSIVAAARAKLDVHVVALLACAENMPDALATRPGDVVRSRSGQTVEVLNTDAEGRLVLCDTLDYAKSFGPKVVLDVATLTGAVVVALGFHATGVMVRDEQAELAEQVIAAGAKSGDRAWRLPLWKEYDQQLKSDYADIPNIQGDGSAGTITAGSFLSRFTKTMNWAHLDIAGVAYREGAGRAATGRPVSMLVEFLKAHAG